MSFSYASGANPSIDYPRFLVGDTQKFQDDGTTIGYIFEDSEILAVASMSVFGIISPNGGIGQTTISTAASPFFVAANLLRGLASNRARLAGINGLLDVKLDTSKTSTELRAMAKDLEDQERNSGAAAIAEQINTSFQTRERMTKQLFRLFRS